ncbi:aminopeptidase P N-terminal domain-containing protein [Pedobacter sp.]|nr:aminopeptidase P N-terminal domain-containing protein [Candidatus Saccharibacteria bacterium]
MDKTFFTNNREQLLRSVGSGALIVINAYQEMQRGNDAAFLFEQEANFWYLTGIEAPDWRLIIDGKRHRSYAVSPDMSEMKEIFDGSLSPEDALRISGVNEVISRDAADSLLLQLKREHPLVYTVNEAAYLKQFVGFAINPAQRELSEYLKHRFSDVRSCGKQLATLRAIKQPIEIKAMQKAIDITIKGFQSMRQQLDSYKYEYESEAKLSYEFRRVGADGHAYSPIVGAGHNACTLHYVANDTKLIKKSFLLIDAGAKYSNYSADITRTYAIGQPSKRMIAIHQAVKDIQTSTIALCRPGTKINDLQKHAEARTEQALSELGLLTGSMTMQDYFPHAIGHGLGIDVHDSFGSYEELQPGMVVTVEPGIYIAEESLGVRIEDDILITETSHRNMSKALSTDL